MDDNTEGVLVKPWFVRDIVIGGVCLYISPVSLVVLLYALYSLVNTLVDKTYCVASHILLTSDDAEKKLKEMRREVKNDVRKFADLAAKHSKCPSGKQGGMLGKFKRHDMAPPFDRAVFDRNNQVNSVIGPIQTSFGWHLIWIHERRIE